MRVKFNFKWPYFFFLLCLTPFSTRSFAGTLNLDLTWKQAETQALQTSPRLKASQADVNAAEAEMNSQYATLFPKLTFESSYRYLSVLPTFTLGGQSLTFGANSSYSVGPVLSYTLFDGGALRSAYQALKFLSESRIAERESTLRQFVGTVRLAYVRVQLALEEQRLTAEALKVSQSQYEDILRRFRVGAASELDRLSAHREVLALLLVFKQRQAELAGSLEDLIALTGNQGGYSDRDLSSPYDHTLTAPPDKDMPLATVLVNLDTLEDSLTQFGIAPSLDQESLSRWANQLNEPNDTDPKLRAQEFLAKASEYSAQTAGGALWPTLQVSAKTSLEYPNGPIAQQIHQNTVAVSLSLPLYEWNRSRYSVEKKLNEAESIQYRREQLALDLKRDWRKAIQLMNSLSNQLTISKETLSEAEKQARLSYSTYRLGRITLTELQAANLRAHESKVQSARITAQLLFQMIQLKTLSAPSASKDSVK